jgi:hypothetical protein
MRAGAAAGFCSLLVVSLHCQTTSTRVRVSHSHGNGGCEGYLFIGKDEIRYEDAIKPAAGISHQFACARNDVTKFELVDNSDHHLTNHSAGLWVNLKCASLGNSETTLFFEPRLRQRPNPDAKRDFLRAKQAIAGTAVSPEPRRPAVPASTKAQQASGQLAQKILEIAQDPRFPGTAKYQALLPTTAEFKSKVIARKLVQNLNTLYGWQLSEDGRWTIKQANDVMFEIVAKPGFEVEKALSAIAANKKPQAPSH